VRRRRRFLASAVAIALAATAMLQQAMPVALAAEPCIDGWRRVLTPIDHSWGSLFDIDQADDGTVMAIATRSRLTTQRSVVLRRSGTGWTRLRTKPFGTTDVLVALEVRGATDAWAVGHFIKDWYRPVAVHWDGASWSRTALPRMAVGAALTDVSLMGRLGAVTVGYALSDRGRQPLALRWTGSQWQDISPRGLGRDAALTGVAAVGPKDAWAVGTAKVSGVLRSLLVRWDGRAWVRYQRVGLGNAESVLTEIVMQGPTAGWALGYRLTARGMLPLVLSWNGSAWREMTAPDASSPITLIRAATASPKGELTVVGTATRGATGYRSAAFRYRDGAWRDAASAGLGRELYGADRVSDRVFVAGAFGWRPVVARECGVSATSAGRERSVGGRDRTPIPLGDETRIPMRIPSLRTAPPIDDPVPPKGYRFRDIARAVGLGGRMVTYGIVTADFDGNGRDDVFVGGHLQAPRLWLNRRSPSGGRFERSNIALRKSDRHGCAAGDVDGDGLPELACTIGAHHGQSLKVEELWFDVAGEPRNTSLDLGLVDPLGRGRRVTFIRADRDGLPDLYVTAEPERVDGLPSVNRLYRNRFPRRFVQAPRAGINDAIGGHCTLATDLDGDRREDLLVCGRSPDGDGLRVYRNLGGSFRDVTRDWGIEPIGDEAVATADIDRDGWPDLIQVSWNRIRVSRNVGRRFVVRWEGAVTRAMGVAAADATGDGRPDLYVVRAGVGEPDLLLAAQPRWEFQSLEIPQARSGNTESVAAIDYDRDGVSEFLVTNGRGQQPGPIQLIAAMPAAEAN
jgi:hypothetical protein